MYLPLIGLALALAWLPGSAGPRARWAAGVGGVVLLALALSTRAEVRHWRGSEPLYRQALKVDPENFMAHYELARLLNVLDRPAEAAAHAGEAARLVPVWSDAYLNLGAALQAQEQHEEAIQAFRRALARMPDSVEAQRRLVRSLLALDRSVEARATLERQLRAQPGDLESRLLLAGLDERQGDRLAASRGYATVCHLAGPTPDGVRAAHALIALIADWPEAPREAREAARQVAPWISDSGNAREREE